MNKIVFLLTAGVFLSGAARAQQVTKHCGNEILMKRMQAANPAAAAQYRAARLADIQAVLSQVRNGTAMHKTTATCPVPVMFHFVVTGTEFTQLGGNKGIINRVLSNLAVINRDFNRKNGDSTIIPAYFKSVYGNVGIQFGLAKLTTSRGISPGIEVLQVAASNKYDINNSCAAAKVSGTGLPAADVSKYLNIWVCNIIDSKSSSSTDVILGVTVPHSILGQTTPDGHKFASSELGMAITPFAFGKRISGSEQYVSGIDLGRTLTHEVGHFFELAHTWGDDEGKCPGEMDSFGNMIGYDDGFSDTPPEADAAAGSPTGKQTDRCNAPNGYMYQNYMDYSNDNVLTMFTTQQSAFMAATVSSGHENASLVADCSLSSSPAFIYLAVGDINAGPESNVSVWPNPANDVLNITINGTSYPQEVNLVNMLGQPAAHIVLNGAKEYKLSTLALPRGVYTLACRFENGLVTQKIVLQ